MDWFSSLYNILKIIFILADLIIFGLLVFLFVNSREFYPRFKFFKAEERIFTLGSVALKERWEAILKRAAAGSPGSIKLAVIEADNFADDIMRRMGIRGQHMADRIEQLSPDDFTTLERLWRAHRLRNQLVHEPNFQISSEEAARVLDDYEAFLNEVGAI